MKKKVKLRKERKPPPHINKGKWAALVLSTVKLLHHRNLESVGVKGLKSEKGKDHIGSN